MRGTTRLGGAVLLICLGALLVAVPVLRPQLAPPARAAQSTCPAPVSIANGDFEAPVLAPNSMSLIPEGDMPGWRTTAPDRVFEHWREIRQGFTAGSGDQFVELNANYVSQLYQDLPTTPGQTLRWELRHRGRLGTDVMATKIGPVGGALVQQGPLISDGAAAWGTWSGIYTVPAGQTSTRFAFDSISAAQNKPTYGNFLDGIAFGNAPCLFTTMGVRGGPANVGDVLTYTAVTTNQGGNPAKNVVFTDDLPAGTAFVPGSIRSISGSSTTVVSDAADADTGEYDAGARRVRVRSGTGAGPSAGGQIAVGEARTITYQVRVTAAAAATTVGNDAAVGYLNALTGTTVTSTSNSVPVAVAPAADLAITAVVAAPGVIAGQGARTVLTVVNRGPDTASTVQASAVVPYGIAGIGATSPQGACAVAGSVATCDIASLAAGATATMNVTGTVIPQATPGAQATLTASVAGATYEIDQADNATSVSAAVATVTDLDVTQSYAPAVPVAGATVTYTAIVTNNGPSTARGIVLTDPVATGSTFVSAGTADGSCVFSVTLTVECTLPDTGPGDVRTVTIVVRLDPAGTGAVNNAVSVSSSTPESDVTDNNFSVQSTGTAQADVGVQLTIGAATAKPGDTVPFTLTVTNYGPSAAGNVSFNTVVPVGFTVNRPASPSCTSTACTFATLPAGAVVKISGSTTVGANAAAGVQQSSTTVISPTTDPKPSNDTSVVTFTIELEADLRAGQALTNDTEAGAPLIAGHDVKGVVTVANDGPTRAEGVVLRQAVPAGLPVPVAAQSGGTCAFQGSGAPGGVTPDGGIYVCTRPVLDTAATWQITFGAVPLPPGWAVGTFARTATVSATTRDPGAADDSVTTTRAVERRSDLRLVTSVSPAAVVQTDQVTFTVRVGNAGPSDATGVLVRQEPDTGLVLLTGTPSTGGYDTGALAWTLPRVPAGAAAAELLLTGMAQASGTLAGRSRIVASGSTDPDPSDNTGTATVTVAAADPVLRLDVLTTLSSGSPAGAAVNDTISYRYRVTNTGNLAVSSLAVFGTAGGAGGCGSTTLAPGAAVTCPAANTVLVDSGDIAAGLPISDTVTVRAQAAVDPEPVVYAQVTASVPVVVAEESLTAVVTATVSPAGHQHAAAAGDLIDYEYMITNNGNVVMDGIVVTDARLGPVGCPVDTLPVGASTTCGIPASGRYAVTPADIDASLPIGTAVTVTGTVDGTAITGSYGPFRTSVTPAAPAPGLGVVVTPSAGAPVRVGETIGYTYAVTNTGNVTVGGLGVTDSHVSGVTCPSATVAAGATLTCRSTPAEPYVVTQADQDGGAPIHNDVIVSAAGVTPGSAVVSAQGSASVAVVPAVAELTLTVTGTTVTPAARATGVLAGDRVAFHYRVRNTGNVTMTGVDVTDTLGGAAGCPATGLAVGTAMDCDSPSYPVRQDDVDAGALTGTVTVHGRAPGQAAAVERDTVPVRVPVAEGVARLVLTGRAVVTPDAHRNGVEAGDTLEYAFTVVNPGTVTMRDVTVEDSRTGAAGCPATVLAPAASMTCRAPQPYEVTAADVAGGEIVNRAFAGGRAGAGPVLMFGPVEIGVPVLVAAPALRVRATAAVTPAAHHDAAQAGDTVTWTYEVINSGNRPMTGIAVTTTRSGPVGCPRAGLAARESMTCAAGTYRVTQADVDAGTAIVERVTVAGRSPDPLTFGPFTARVGVAEPQPALRLRMSAAITAAARAAAGSTVRYGYRVTNTGNVTVRSIAVTDRLAGPVTCRDSRLGVGAATSCTADRAYRVTQDDIDAGRPLTARAAARGLWSPADRAVTSNTADASVPVAAPAPRLTATPTATWRDTDGDGRLGTGDDVTSTVDVRNDGNVTLVDVRVTGLPAPVTCPGTRLAPGGTVTCRSGVYHLTAHEVAAGRHTYEVLVTGARTAGDAGPVEVTAPSTVVVPQREPYGGRPPGTVPVTGSSAAAIVLGLTLITAGVALLLLTGRRPGVPAHP
ncbi:DUF11 domain-containing protein [Actinoplanes sp. DH11]|uniref:DUF7507 domain-containing protein n=1 Tax=Actinoplanes sp. DH11 TaxID=2857011 RepID=UPI001E30CD53|nr:DUF11 domain-containing protein [Actinoplanes sp. DH11]